MFCKRTFLIGLTALALTGAMLTPPAMATAPTDEDTREVLFVGNNWDGTLDAVAPDGDLEHPARIDVIPDLDQRKREIYTNPVRLMYYLGIRHLIGEGHDRSVDDMHTTSDGELPVVSRPSLADVVGIDLDSGELAWRFRVDGQRADHMTISPGGKHVAVSAPTGNVVHILDVDTGEEGGSFPTGDSPQGNVYSRDGAKIFHSSIGTVYTPLDQPWLDSTKGERYFQVVDAKTNEVLQRIDMGQKFDEAGYPELSSASRPMTFSPGRAVPLLPGLVLPQLPGVRPGTGTGGSDGPAADRRSCQESAARTVPAAPATESQ